MADDDLSFDFEAALHHVDAAQAQQEAQEPPDLPAEEIGQQPGNFKKNYRQTVCTYWLRNLCMKGDQCGFLHEFVPERMPVCRTLLKYGECKELDCPFKHSMDEVKDCNMYKLGFCIYGPQCRYKHKKETGPPPDPETIEAAKPREHRDVNVVVNTVNPGVVNTDRPGGRNFEDRERLGYGGFSKRPRLLEGGSGRGGGFGGGRGRGGAAHMLALPAPGDVPQPWGGGGLAAQQQHAHQQRGFPMGMGFQPLGMPLVPGPMPPPGPPPMHLQQAYNQPRPPPGNPPPYALST